MSSSTQDVAPDGGSGFQGEPPGGGGSNHSGPPFSGIGSPGAAVNQQN